MTTTNNHHPSNEQSLEELAMEAALKVDPLSPYGARLVILTALTTAVTPLKEERDAWHAAADRNIAKANSLEGQLTASQERVKELEKALKEIAKETVVCCEGLKAPQKFPTKGARIAKSFLDLRATDGCKVTTETKQ